MLAPITQIAVRTPRPFIFSPSFAGDTIPIEVEAFQASTVVVYDCHGQRHIGLLFCPDFGRNERHNRSVLTPSNYGRSAPSPTFFDRGSPKAEATGSNPVGCTNIINNLSRMSGFRRGFGHHQGSTAAQVTSVNAALRVAIFSNASNRSFACSAFFSSASHRLNIADNTDSLSRPSAFPNRHNQS
jgi:hypothetical protein